MLYRDLAIVMTDSVLNQCRVSLVLAPRIPSTEFHHDDYGVAAHTIISAVSADVPQISVSVKRACLRHLDWLRIL